MYRGSGGAPRRDSSTPSIEPPVVLAPVDVDPRSWFSNERTCIEWLHSAAILGAFAAGLVSTGDQASVLAGILLGLPALLVALHAARMHHVRAKQLDHRAVSAHFDRIGPTLYAFPLAVGLMFNLMVAVSKRTWPANKLYVPGAEFGQDPGASSVPGEFWIGGSALILAVATVLLCPSTQCCSALLGGGETRSSLSQPFLDSEQHVSASVGPLRPKLLYANERTFIHWSHTCTLLASTAMTVTSRRSLGGALQRDETQDGSTMMDGSSIALYVGTLLSVAALALLGYAHRAYFWRAQAITSHSEARVDDPMGPPMLACILLLTIGGGMAALLPQAMAI